MESINKLIQKVQKTEHGFKEMQKEAENIAKNNSVKECINISSRLFSSKVYQARMPATFIFRLISLQVNSLNLGANKDE